MPPDIEKHFNGVVIEWDTEKADSVWLEHGVTFEEAITVLLDDPNAITDIDTRDYEGEERYITLGMSNQGRLLVVVWTLRDVCYRIISSWQANRQNQRSYFNG